MLSKLTMLIISRYTQMSNNYAVHLELILFVCQLYLNKSRGKKEESGIKYLKCSKNENPNWEFCIWWKYHSEVKEKEVFLRQRKTGNLMPVNWPYWNFKRSSFEGKKMLWVEKKGRALGKK